MSDGNFFVRIATLIVHVLLIILHCIAAIINGFCGRQRKVHILAANISRQVISRWITKRGDDWRFHHRDYALASMLIPGNLSIFGKWMLLDDIVGYDSLGLFERSSHMFVRDQTGKIVLATLPAQHYPGPDADPLLIDKPMDGMLRLISAPSEGLNDNIHPSDNFFVKHWDAIIGELKQGYKPWGSADAPTLNKIAILNGEIIDAIIAAKPDLPIDLDLIRMMKK